MTFITATEFKTEDTQYTYYLVAISGPQYKVNLGGVAINDTEGVSYPQESWPEYSTVPLKNFN